MKSHLVLCIVALAIAGCTGVGMAGEPANTEQLPPRKGHGAQGR